MPKLTGLIDGISALVKKASGSVAKAADDAVAGVKDIGSTAKETVDDSVKLTKKAFGLEKPQPEVLPKYTGDPVNNAPVTYDNVDNIFLSNPDAVDYIVNSIGRGANPAQVKGMAEELISTGGVKPQNFARDFLDSEMFKALDPQKQASKTKEVAERLTLNVKSTWNNFLQEDGFPTYVSNSLKGAGVKTEDVASRRGLGFYATKLLPFTEQMQPFANSTGIPVDMLPHHWVMAMGDRDVALKGMLNMEPDYLKGARAQLAELAAGEDDAAKYAGRLKSIDDMMSNPEKYRADSLMKDAKDVGLDGKQVAKYLEYVESTPEGPKFVKAGKKVAGKLDIKPFEESGLVEPNESQKEYLFRQRRLWDFMQTQHEGDYLERYVPLMNKSLIGKEVGTRTGVIAAELERSSGARSEKHVDDIFEMMNKSFNQIAFSKNMGGMLGETYRMINLSRTFMGEKVGDGGYGDRIEQMLAEVLGIKSVAGLRKAATYDLFGKTKQHMEETLKFLELENAPLLSRKVNQALKEVAARTIFGTSARAILMQHYQPEMVGAVELGDGWIRSARKLLKSDPKKWGEVIKDVEKTAMGDTFNPMMESSASQIGKGGRLLINAASLPAAPGFEMWKATDLKSRRIVYLAAWLKFNRKIATNPEELFAPLSNSQRYAVEQHLEKHGVESASKYYAQTMQLRSNLIYHTMDAPELFVQFKLHKLIPFTTWNRAMWGRALGDVRTGNFDQLARRFTVPIAYLSAINWMTGINLMGAHPMSAITEGFDVDVHPIYQPLWSAMKGDFNDAANQAGKLVSWYKLFKKYKDFEKDPSLKTALRGASLRYDPDRNYVTTGFGPPAPPYGGGPVPKSDIEHTVKRREDLFARRRRDAKIKLGIYGGDDKSLSNTEFFKEQTQTPKQVVVKRRIQDFLKGR